MDSVCIYHEDTKELDIFAVNKTEEDIRDVRQNIKDKVNKYIIKETGKRPVILPVIIEL